MPILSHSPYQTISSSEPRPSMAPFRLSPSSTTNETTPDPAGSSTSRKRKWEEGDKTDHHPQGISLKLPNAIKWALDTELHLHMTHMPNSNLDIKMSRQPTNMRTFKVHQTGSSPDPLSPLHMSLDLELNLPCGSAAVGRRKYHAAHQNTNILNINSHAAAADHADHHLSLSFGDNLHRPKNITNPVVSVHKGDDHGWDQREMVTAVCKKCYMLVMMSKASPACPNCKFMHPLDQSPPNLFKRGGGGEGLARSFVSIWN